MTDKKYEIAADSVLKLLRETLNVMGYGDVTVYDAVVFLESKQKAGHKVQPLNITEPR